MLCTIAEIISILNHGGTVVAIDRRDKNKRFRMACKKSKGSNQRVTCADYVSYDSGRTWKLVSSEPVCELRLADCAETLMRMSEYCEILSDY